jgi:hypothetical protein
MTTIDERPIKVSYNVRIQLWDEMGNVKKDETIHNIITNVGLAHIADQMSDQGEVAMSHMAVGDDADPKAAAGDTTLNSEISRVTLTSITQTANVTVVYVGDWAAGVGTDGNLCEAGIFNDDTAGTMLSRATFTSTDKQAADTMKITWTVTFADDGVE